MTDRFDAMLRTLAGEPLPPLPALPGRVHHPLDVAALKPIEQVDAELKAAAIWAELAAEVQHP